MRSALTRLTLLFGASVVLYASVGSGVALAGNPCDQANAPSECQYQVNYGPKLKPPKHQTSGATRHTSTTTTPATSSISTDSSETVPVITGKQGAVVRTRHHRGEHRPNKRHLKSGKARVRHIRASSRSRRVNSHKPTSNSTRLAATGSSGGIGVWLPVVLALVLVGGSAAGIFRYRRTH